MSSFSDGRQSAGSHVCGAVVPDTRPATIEIEPSSPMWPSKNIWIRNNDVGPGRLFFFAGVGLYGSSHISITRNSFRGGLRCGAIAAETPMSCSPRAPHLRPPKRTFAPR